MFAPKVLLICSFIVLAQAAMFMNWGYSSRGNDWEGICSEGSNQSPINIPFAESSNFTEIADDYLKTQFDFGVTDSYTVENNGHTLNFYFDGEDISSTVRVPVVDGELFGILGDGDKNEGNTTYATGFLYSFHLNVPGEHTYNGFVAPVEGQMAMLILKEFLPSCPQEACLAMINFRFDYNAFLDVESPFLADILYQIGGEWPEEGETKVAVNGTLDFSDLAGEDHPSYAAYSGSMTMPPCTEYVLWYIMQKSVPISVAQLDQLQALFTPDEDGVLRNSRLTQPLNGRSIAYVK